MYRTHPHGAPPLLLLPILHQLLNELIQLLRAPNAGAAQHRQVLDVLHAHPPLMVEIRRQWPFLVDKLQEADWMYGLLQGEAAAMGEYFGDDDHQRRMDVDEGGGVGGCGDDYFFE